MLPAPASRLRSSRCVAAALGTAFAPVVAVLLASAPAPSAAAPNPELRGPAAAAYAASVTVPIEAERQPRSSPVDWWVANARQAAATCPGLPATVLLAIAHVETRMSDLVGPSPAGAIGPMQFMPATWAAYGVDGDGDGDTDIRDPKDALHAAARLLCANGGGDPTRIRSALWNYNHSADYVERVASLAGVALPDAPGGGT